MKDNKKEPISTNEEVSQIRGIEKNHLLTDKVKNISEMKVTDALYNSIKKAIKDGPQDEATQKVYEELSNSIFKNVIAKEQPQFYNQFADLDWKQMYARMKNPEKLEDNQPLEFFVQDGNGKLTTTTFQISPNSYWSNMTNILNRVSIGDNRISLGESFNAYDEFYVGYLESGEAMLRTMGYSLVGVNQLDQNSLVPNSTQEVAGYQASLGVFINTTSAMKVGGGKGFGLFTLFAKPENVMKLATTQPQQLATIVQLFRDTALNTLTYVKWMVCTVNFLQNINNYVIDMNNQNIRNCLNATLFPAIQISKCPTWEFNTGVNTYLNANNNPWVPNDLAQNEANGWTKMTYQMLQNPQGLSQYKYSYKTLKLDSPYLVQGSQELPRIQPKYTDDIHLILTPRFSVIFKSGTLSELFHWEYQQLDNYVRPENVHLLYKQVDMIAGPMNTPVSTQTLPNGETIETYPFQVPALLGKRWIPDNCIVVYYKGRDPNSWTANYYDVWYNELQNQWGAGQISTVYNHFAFGGGVIPYSNGFICYMQNLLNTVSDGSEPIFTEFDLDTVTQIQGLTR